LKKLREILDESGGFLGTNIATMRHIGVSADRAIGLTALKKSVFKRLRGGLPRKLYSIGAMKQSVYQKIGLYNNPKMAMVRQAVKGNIPVQTPFGVFKTGGGMGGSNRPISTRPGNAMPGLRRTAPKPRDILAHHKQQSGGTRVPFKATQNQTRTGIRSGSWNRPQRGKF
jgi:hypothetical protein